MKLSKGKVLSAFFILFAAGSFATAHAAECTITSANIDKIKAIQNDPTLSYSDEITQELNLRKQLVSKTIGCAQQEVVTLQTSLNAVLTGDTAKPLQTQFLGRLDDATNYYSIELARVNTAGIAGTQAIAKEVLGWRAGTFVPLSKNINNFILWSENQTLFDTAQTRLSQTQRAVSFLESASPNADLQNALNAATASFADATSNNNAAKDALSQGLSPDQSLTLIKQSLDSLSATYQGFFTVSTIIKGILPQ